MIFYFFHKCIIFSILLLTFTFQIQSKNRIDKEDNWKKNNYFFLKKQK
jgi:hypothetical protein